MWYDTLKGEWPEIFREKLVDEKKYVDIGDMFAAVDVTELLKAGKLTEAREKTLTYLHTLLQEGKVKVGGVIRVDPNKPRPDPKTMVEISIFKDMEGTPDEIIEHIRHEWNHNPDFSESYDCVIRLPENPWLV